MQPQWTDGYVAEIGYTYGFYRELTPALIQYALLANGVLPPALDGPYTYCELGFGQGVSTNLLAAANPRGRFWGTDFNPEQASHARELARLGHTEAQLFDDSFEEFAARDTPQFDIIALHGTWSWVSAPAQAAIVRILRDKLKVGGALYISYNVLPGWANEAPLRDLLMLHTGHGSAPGTGITRRIEDALHFADSLQAGGARFFQANPRLAEFLKDMKSDDRQYLAHEYFNQSWDLIYFSDLARALQPAKLGYAASLHQLDLLEVLRHRGAIAKTIERIASPVLREVARDFALNRRFRRDLFTRGARRLAPAERTERLLDLRVVLQGAPADVPTECCGPENEVPIDAAVMTPLLEVLASGTPDRPLREVRADARLASVSTEQLLLAVHQLIALRHAHPVFPADSALRKQSQARHFNEVVARQARFHNHIKYLASPVLTGAVGVNRFQLLFLLARQQKLQTPEQWARFACDAAVAGEGGLKLPGRVIDQPGQCLDEFRQRAAEFATQDLPAFQALGMA